MCVCDSERNGRGGGERDEGREGEGGRGIEETREGQKEGERVSTS